ncbi:MAG TPA: DUF4920 domain-containing protein [Kofleriaceae bacterium]|jgi:hypothetical protein
MLRTTAFALLVFVAACDKGPTKSTPAPEAKSAEPVAGPNGTAVKTPDGQKFGAGVTLADTTTIGAILADPTAFKGKTVRVEGTVTDVCEMRGCWFEMAGTEPGQKLKFKVTDGEMVFPVDSKGKHAIAQGNVSVHELTLEQTKEMAEEEAKEHGQQFDPATVTKATQLVRLDGTGAVFSDKI